MVIRIPLGHLCGEPSLLYFLLDTGGQAKTEGQADAELDAGNRRRTGQRIDSELQEPRTAQEMSTECRYQ